MSTVKRPYILPLLPKAKKIIKLLHLHGETLNTHASAYKFICQRFTPKGELLPPPTSCQHLVKRYRSTKYVEESNPSPWETD